MNTVMTPVPPDHPLMRAWNAYKKTPGFENAMQWLAHEEHREGQMWSAFMAGWQAGEARRPTVLDASRLSRRDRTELLDQAAKSGGHIKVAPLTPPPVSMGLVRLTLVCVIFGVGFLFWWFVLSR